MHDILKTGSSSIIIGEKYYEGHFPKKTGKLLKITKLIENHNEFKHLKKIRGIHNYENYYSIPDDEIKLLLKDSEFFNKLKLLTKYDKMSIFNSDLHIMYIDYAGSIDVLDSIEYLSINGTSYIWKNYGSILNFTKQMVCSLKYLHNINLCHLDIKPENIMIIIKNGVIVFKLIDFGFCSEEPFDDFVKYYKGTPGYFPSDFENIQYIQPGLPKILANDMDPINGIIKMSLNRGLVYKIDSYCLGRVINYITFMYSEHQIPYCCFNLIFKNRKIDKINKIIDLLLEKCVNKRVTITQLYDMNLF
jgi:serine/threonine protein kinase